MTTTGSDKKRLWVCRACGPGQRHFYQGVQVSSFVDIDEFGETFAYGSWEDTDYYGDVNCNACGELADNWDPGLDELDVIVNGDDDDGDAPELDIGPVMTPLEVIDWVLHNNHTLSTVEVETLVATRDALRADTDAGFDPESGD